MAITGYGKLYVPVRKVLNERASIAGFELVDYLVF